MESVKIKTSLGIYLAQARSITEGLEVFIPYDEVLHEEIFSQKSLTPEWLIYFNNVQKQINEFFKGERKTFGLKVNPNGSTFQKIVWKELMKIPYGKTVSYQDIAIKIKNLKASRAIGSANGKNPIHIIIPCHRVVRKSGDLGGYSAGINKKKQLLELEKNNEAK